MSEIITATAELTVQDHFAPFEAQAKEWLEKANQIKVTDESQVELMKGARTARLALAKIRVAIENTRVELKEEYLRKGNAIQEIANRLRDKIKPIEAILQEQEDFLEIQKEKRKRELFNARLLELKPFCPEAEMFPLGDMQQQAFENMLLGYKVAKEQKEKAEIEEKERIAKEKLERQAEEKRIREENAKLKEQNDRVIRLTSIGFRYLETSTSFYHDGLAWGILKDKVNKMTPSEFDDLYQNSAKKVIARNQKISDDALAEKSRLERERIKQDEKLRKEREERKRLEEEAKARADKEEAELRSVRAAERKMKRAPDKTKLVEWASHIQSLWEDAEDDLKFKDEEAGKIFTQSGVLMLKIVSYIKDNAEKL